MLDARAAICLTVISSLREDLDLGAEFAEVLHEVVGEAVVVTDHQQHGRALLFAVAMLRGTPVSRREDF